MAIKFDLHISATSAEDLKAQLKQALLELGGAEANPQDVATPNNNTEKNYKQQIAEKTKAAMDKKKANLERFTGQVYGWDVDENNSLIPNWDEQQKILMMREMLLHYSYSEVAKEYNRVGFVGKNGGKFTSSIISRIASNELHERVVEFEGPELTRYLIRKARLEQQEAGVRAKALEQGLIKSPKTKPSKKAEAKARKALKKVKPKKVKPKKVRPKTVIAGKTNPFIETAKEMSPAVLQKLSRRYTRLNTPFGWRRNSDGFIAPHESEQEIIAEWRTLHYGKKVSLAKLARTAAKSKLPTERKPDGKTRWSKSEIKRILANPIHGYYQENYGKSNSAKVVTPKKQKKTKKAEKKLAPVHPWKQERLSSEVSFSLWCEENLIPIIMKEKTFVIGTRLIEAWFKATKANYGESYDQWSTVHQQSIMTHVKKAFNLISKNASSYVSVQDAGDNCVLMVERPQQLTTKILEKAFEGWTDIGAE